MVGADAFELVMYRPQHGQVARASRTKPSHDQVVKGILQPVDRLDDFFRGHAPPHREIEGEYRERRPGLQAR
jgi:hypothetical protein